LTAGVIAAIVIAFFTVGVLIGVALTWVNLSRKQKLKGTLNYFNVISCDCLYLFFKKMFKKCCGVGCMFEFIDGYK
jgi:L-cystine uptake protein TcyP (sodium:dicarboxylate symporter family)